ncbi:hypothetical protein NL676_015107 [Syzygium grande]|nr:hypothetical protein NL676_015107 [Syzygium grande]
MASTYSCTAVAISSGSTSSPHQRSRPRVLPWRWSMWARAASGSRCGAQLCDYHCREAEPHLAGPDHGVVILDPARVDALLEDPAWEGRQARPRNAADQEAAQLRQGRGVGAAEPGSSITVDFLSL